MVTYLILRLQHVRKHHTDISITSVKMFFQCSYQIMAQR